MEERVLTLIRSSNKDGETAEQAIKEAKLNYRVVFSDEHKPVVIDPLSAYAYKGIKEIEIFCKIFRRTLSQTEELSCPNCGDKHYETDCGGFCTAFCLQESEGKIF